MACRKNTLNKLILLLLCLLGIVSLWTPNMKEPAAKILCHASCLRDVAVDFSGKSVNIRSCVYILTSRPANENILCSCIDIEVS